MRYFVDQSTRLVVHGINGDIGRIVSEDYQDKGINLVGGVSAGEGGSWAVDGTIPVFDSVQASFASVLPEAVIIAGQGHTALQAILESIYSHIRLIICLTKDIPVQDLAKIKKVIKNSSVQFLGPETFGIFTPGYLTVGTFPNLNIKKGRVGLISRSNLVAFEAASLLSEDGFGISNAIGLSAGPDIGINLLEILQIFDQDPETDQIILIDSCLGIYADDTLAYFTNALSKQLIVYIPKISDPAHVGKPYTGSVNNENDQKLLSKYETLKNVGLPLANSLFHTIKLLKYS